ncbi:MAG: DNRLRE domain-containing protein [archaeon]
MDKKSLVVFSLGVFLILTFMVMLINTNRTFLTGFTTYTPLQPNSTTGVDTYIREASEVNYATSSILRIGKTIAPIEFKSFLNFNLSDIPPGDTILNATLQVYVENSYGSGNRTIKIYRVTENWTEDGATWTKRTAENYWFSQGGEYDTNNLIDSKVFTNQSGVYYNFTLTYLVGSWMNGSYNNYGFVLVATIATAENGNYTEISSSDSITESYRPILFIVHDPNSAPTIINVSSTTNSTNFANEGEEINFTVYLEDLESNPTRLFVCNSSNIDDSGCGDYQYCNTSLSETNVHECSYTVQNSDNRTTLYWVAICEVSQCSTLENSSFYINHIPFVTGIIQPNGGETINQTSGGNYQIKFTVIDPDSDNLSANIYYSEIQNNFQNLITSITLNSTYCNDVDSNTATPPNNCWYWWNTTGIYGTYYLVINLSDSNSNRTNSSTGTFDVVSLMDPYPPEIYNILIDSPIHSGKNVTINATILDDNKITAWVAFNQTIQNATMKNITSTLFGTSFEAPETGIYEYKVFAKDIVGNLNDSMPWESFEIFPPNATTQNEFYPSTALPYHVIKITGEINAINDLKNVSAYLNVPEGFTFLKDYPQLAELGDISAGSSKNATWYLSTPLQESTYNLNITFSDKYSNSWNSANMQIVITSAIGGYEISMTGYPEVETGNDYYAEAYFKQSGVYINPDSIRIELYDASGIKVLGPVEMSQKSTGIYNYSYEIGPSVTEGQWKTLINATKFGNSYYTYEFWKVVGGPFDIRDITVIKDTIPDLNISFIAENTGGVNKDLILTWNLTRLDTGGMLDAGGETRMVPANSEIIWYINPETTYVGQTKITILGYYSGTEKIGGYEIFSTRESGEEVPTPPSGGGGGEAVIPIVPRIVEKTGKMNVVAEELVAVTKNIPKKTKVIIENIGDSPINNITLEVIGINKSDYSVFPIKIDKINSKESSFFEVTYLIMGDIGSEIEIIYLIKSNEVVDTEKTAKLLVLGIKDYFEREMQKLIERTKKLKELAFETGKEELLQEFQICEEKINVLQESLNNEDFYEVSNNIGIAEECLDNVEKKLNEEQKLISIKTIERIFIVTLIIILIFLILTYLIYKRLDLMNFLRRQQINVRGSEKENASVRKLDDKLKYLEKKMGIRK